MKRTLLLAVSMIVATTLVAQDINTIVERHEKAINVKKLNSFKTIKVIGSMSQMGMSMDMTIIEKVPDKIKTVITFSEMEIVTVVNGDKGYMINPMMGSSEPVALKVDEIIQARKSKMLGSSIRKQLKDGKLEFAGMEKFNGTDCYKIKNQTTVGESFAFIDKKSYYIIGIIMTTGPADHEMQVEMRMSEFKEIKGVTMAMKTDTYVSGQMSGSLVFTSIEFDLPVNDSEFAIK